MAEKIVQTAGRDCSNHYVTNDKHDHRHTQKELEQLPGAMHV